MEWNAESVLDALNDFERKPELNAILDEYLLRIAKNGEIVFPWSKLKPLLKKKLEVVLDEFYETCPVETSVPVPNFETFNFDSLKKTILQAVDAFTSAPFTIQRLCELVTNPQKHYNRTDKYMRGIEKNVLVVSTIEPRSGSQGDGNNANNNVIVNGMINDSPREESDALNGHESESSDSVTSSNLDTPSNHVLLENFANVFPSAACIPSASNICMKPEPEIDSNFISTSAECTEEVDFEGTASTASDQPAEDEKVKDDEPMDTSEEDSSTSTTSSDESKVCSEEEAKSSEELETELEGVPEKKIKLDTEVTLVEVSESVDSDSNLTEMDSTSAAEEVENEIEKSEIEINTVSDNIPTSPKEDDEEVKVEKLSEQDHVVSENDSVSDNDDISKTETNVTVEEEICKSEPVKEEVAEDKTEQSV